MDRREAFRLAAAALLSSGLPATEQPTFKAMRLNVWHREQFFKGNLTLNEWRKMEGKEPIGELGDAKYAQPISNLLSS